MGHALYKSFYFCISSVIFSIINFYPGSNLFGQRISKNKTYYFNSKGANKNDGTRQHPWKTLSKLRSLALSAGDTIFLNSIDSFSGTLKIKSNTNGTAEKPIIITSYGAGKAVISSNNNVAISLKKSSYIHIKNIICKGSGRKQGNTTNGISVDSCSFINIENIEVFGFQKSGLNINTCSNVKADNVYAYNNGFAGIYINGNISKESCSGIIITNCKAENNPGDPTALGNHSGNGILAGYCKNVLIDHCTATNNGWDMPRIGNGPIGIWCYEADSVTIQHCISYKNKTSKGGEDGGGYDLDGGVTNSVIQYCLSYENQGSGFGIFQYAGASPWHNNTIRFCISENDGNVSAAKANTYIWNSSHDSSQLKSLLFYNNTIYNNTGAAISYSVESDHSDFRFYNNIFVAANELIRGNEAGDVFLANNWWSLLSGFNIDSINNFQNWILHNNKEQLNGEVKGMNVMPPFKNAGNTTLQDANQLINFDNYKIIDSSPLAQSGIDLQGLLNINTGSLDFRGRAVQKKYLGACSD